MKLTITLRSEDFSKLILLSVATQRSYDDIVDILIAHYAPQEPSCDLKCHRRSVDTAVSTSLVDEVRDSTDPKTILDSIDTIVHSAEPGCLARIERWTAELVRRGIYPEETVPGNPNSVVDMVRGWGSRWFEWKGPLACPLCQADLRDYHRGPPFKREHSIIDGFHNPFFTCPDCKGRLP